MRPLMTTTALVAAIAAGSAALAQSDDNPFAFEGASETDLHASNLIGMSVYAAEPASDGAAWSMEETAGLQTDWQDVGEINDLIVTRDGTVASVLVDIGGFLGIGERQVAMDMDDIRFVSDTDTEAADDFFLVIPASMADFEAAPEYEGFAATETETNPSVGGGAAETDMAFSETPLTAEEIAVLTVEDLTGARVYDPSGEWIGEISELLLADDAAIEAAVVDVGGFLGIGEKPVRVAIDEMIINPYEDGDGIRVSVPMTQQELEQLPTWES